MQVREKAIKSGSDHAHEWTTRSGADEKKKNAAKVVEK